MKRMGEFLGMLAVLSLVLTAGAVAQHLAPTDQSTAASQQPQGGQPPAGHQPATLSTLHGVLVSTESLLGIEVRNPQGEEVGKIKHLMIDPHTGLTMYAVVSMGGFLGMGDKTVVVPWRDMAVARDGTALVLNVPKHLLPPASEYETGQKATLAGPRSPAYEGSGGWGAETPYGQLYDPAQEQTISGQVESVEIAAPLPDMAPGTQMLVQTEGAKTTRVHMGPAWYMERQDVRLQKNTQVQVTIATKTPFPTRTGDGKPGGPSYLWCRPGSAYGVSNNAPAIGRAWSRAAGCLSCTALTGEPAITLRWGILTLIQQASFALIALIIGYSRLCRRDSSAFS
jgi:sporulation protein YlmC with PRC-barrel domain